MKRIRIFTLMLAALAMVVAPSVVDAQPGGQRPGGQGGQRQGGGFGRGGMTGGARPVSITQLLQIEKVREDAEILDEQVEDIKTAVDKVRQDARTNQGERPNFRELTEAQREEFFKKFREQQETTNKKIQEAIEDVLLPQQVERLNEIRLQIQGVGALLTEPVQKELKITAEQKTKFAEIQKETQEKGQELFSGVRELFQGGDREKAQAAMQEIREKMTNMQKETEKSIVGVLTDSQKKEFDKMKGKPVEISQEELRPSRGGQGGQGGQRQGGQRPGGQGGQGGQRPAPGARPAT
jgi:Spy/CpxP family protein refolding chaperone